MMSDATGALTQDGFNQIQRELLESEIKIWPSRSWSPSAIGHPCDRHLTWRFTRHAEQSRYSYVLQSIFNYGTGREKIIRARMETMGFEWVETDRPTQYVLPGGAIISGRLDGKIKGFRGVRIPTYVAEIKTMSSYQWDAVDSVEDLRRAKYFRTRGWYSQLQLYLLMENIPLGVFVLESKATGLLKLVPCEIDFAHSEELLQRIERLDPLMKKREDPPPIPYDAMVCGDCGFNRICYPPKIAGTGTGMIEDAALLEMLEERGRVEEAKSTFDGLDKKVKARVKQLVASGETAICGPWTISIKEVPKHFNATAARDTVEQHVKLERIE